MFAPLSMHPNPRTPHAPASTAALVLKATRRRARWQAAARKLIAPRGGSYFG